MLVCPFQVGLALLERLIAPNLVEKLYLTIAVFRHEGLLLREREPLHKLVKLLIEHLYLPQIYPGRLDWNASVLEDVHVLQQAQRKLLLDSGRVAWVTRQVEIDKAFI